MHKIDRRDLLGEQLTLIPLNLNNYSDDYVDWLNDPEVNRYLESRFSKITNNMIKEYIQKNNSNNNTLLYGIFYNKNNRHVGNIKIGTVNWNHYFSEIGYFIGDKNLWGKGLATEAIFLATNFALHDMKLVKCKAGVYSNNIGSIRALEKVGYILEGKCNNEFIGPNGREDHLIYGISKQELKINKSGT